MKRYPLTIQQSQEYAGSSGLLLSGFTVSPDHSIVADERGKEYAYSRKSPEQRTPRPERKASALWP